MHSISPAPKPAILKFKESPERQNQTSFTWEFPEYHQQSPYPKQSLRAQIRQRLFPMPNGSPGKHLKDNDTSLDIKRQQQIQYLKQLVIQLQSHQNDGYYMYRNWLDLNGYIFPQVQDKYTQNLWKILRMINFGEVLIPSGLIYDVINQINNRTVSLRIQQEGIVQIINQFLSDNGIQNSYSSFKQLQNYIPLLKILQGYRLQSQQKQLEPTSSSQTGLVFQNLYNDSMARRHKQTLVNLSSHKEQTQGCTFAPKINRCKTAQKKKTKSYHKFNCDSITKNVFNTDREEEPMTVIKARPVDPRIYDIQVSDLKGVRQHINRAVDSYKEKLRLRRSIQKPVIIRKT